MIVVNRPTFLVDAETGEFVEIPAGTSIKTPVELKKMKIGMRGRKSLAVESKAVTKWIDKNCGEFFWCLYQPCGKYYEGISDRLLADMLFLLSFVDYDVNKLVCISQSKRDMSKKDVRKIVKGHSRDFNEFWQQVTETGVIREEQNGALVVTERFKKGDLALSGSIAMKIFCQPLRQLYYKLADEDLRKLAYLSYLYRLIPYVNLKYNVVCRNPFEGQRVKIEELSVKEICGILRICPKNQKRFMLNLQSLCFTDKNGVEKYAVKFVQKNKKQRNVIINPQIYSGCISAAELDEFDEMFRKES